MDYSSSVVADLAVIMIIGAVVGFLIYRIRQPLIIGYLIAGIIIALLTRHFHIISKPDVFSATADLGVILLIFGLGLKFPLSRLISVGKVSIGVAAIQVVFMLTISFTIRNYFEWSLLEALFLGTALASSSTAVISRTLGDMRKMQETPTLIMLGILVIEDLVVVGLVTAISANIEYGVLNYSNVAFAMIKTISFIVGSLVLGILLVPLIINHLVRTGNKEVAILTTLGFVFGLSILAYYLGFPLAVGAFLMGVIVASSKAVEYISGIINSIRDMFAAIFFVSMGALIDITQFQDFLIPALIITGIMMFTKAVGCVAGTRIFGYNMETSVKVGLGMVQIGEFAFIVMKVGLDAGLISTVMFSMVGVSAAVSTFFTPYLIKLSYKINYGYRISFRKKPKKPVEEQPPP